MELKVTRCSVDEHGVATVHLHRPERANAWTGRMHAEYRWVLASLDADPAVRVVVVTGTGRAFCVGGDKAALASTSGPVSTGVTSFDAMSTCMMSPTRRSKLYDVKSSARPSGVHESGR